MKIISAAAVTAGGKTTVVNKLKERFDSVCTLNFGDYTFEGEVDNFYQWVLDVALARRILRDMTEASGDEIRNDLELYLKYARIAFVQMQKDVLPSSDYVNGKSICFVSD